MQPGGHLCCYYKTPGKQIIKLHCVVVNNKKYTVWLIRNFCDGLKHNGDERGFEYHSRVTHTLQKIDSHIYLGNISLKIPVNKIPYSLPN